MPEEDPVDLEGPERAALEALADSGLLPPLRLVRPVSAARDTGDEDPSTFLDT